MVSLFLTGGPTPRAGASRAATCKPEPPGGQPLALAQHPAAMRAAGSRSLRAGARRIRSAGAPSRSTPSQASPISLAAARGETAFRPGVAMGLGGRLVTDNRNRFERIEIRLETRDPDVISTQLPQSRRPAEWRIGAIGREFRVSTRGARNQSWGRQGHHGQPRPAITSARSKQRRLKAGHAGRCGCRSRNADRAPSPAGATRRTPAPALPAFRRCFHRPCRSTPPSQSSSAKRKQSLQSGSRRRHRREGGAATRPTEAGSAGAAIRRWPGPVARASGQPGPAAWPIARPDQGHQLQYQPLLPALLQSGRASQLASAAGPALFHMAGAWPGSPGATACCRAPVAPLPTLLLLSAGGAPVGWPPGRRPLVPSHWGGAPR